MWGRISNTGRQRNIQAGDVASSAKMMMVVVGKIGEHLARNLFQYRIHVHFRT
jgi:hypothetical protein